MPRAIWSGALTFGLVNVPVKLFTAVTQKEVRFHMLHGKDGGRIRMKRFCSVEDREVPYEEIVKGFEISKDRYVTMTEEELASFDPKATRTIEIRDFVDLAEIDPIYYETTYYLAPDATAAKAYRLLVDALRRAGKVGIASFVLRTREALCCVRPLGDALAISTMNRADEVVPVSLARAPAGERALGPRAADGRAARRVALGAVRARALPRHPPRAGAGAGREEGGRRGDRASAGGAGARRPS